MSDVSHPGNVETQGDATGSHGYTDIRRMEPIELIAILHHKDSGKDEYRPQHHTQPIDTQQRHLRHGAERPHQNTCHENDHQQQTDSQPMQVLPIVIINELHADGIEHMNHPQNHEEYKR